MNKILEKVNNFIQENYLLKSESCVLVGLSGGPDSVCLLRMLVSLGYKVVAVHCNFHLRGEESMRDEHFAETLAHELNVQYNKVDFDTVKWAKEHKVSIEMAARELRYNYFREKKAEYNCDAIAVGHHQDDNVETMLLNLVRGTGIKGASAIQPKNGDIIRPLLRITRNEITNYLDSINQSYVTDHTNLEDEYSRNKIRLNVMPLLQSINTSASDNIASTIENLNEARKVYEAGIRASINDCCSTNELGETLIEKEMLLKQPSSISILHEVLSPIGFNKKQIKDILCSMNECGKMFIASQRILIDRSHIIVESQHYPTPTIETSSLRREDVSINKDNTFAYIDTEKLKGELIIREPKEGDTFAPFGMRGKRKLISDFLTDKKLSRFAKEHQPLLCDGDEIVWVVGLRTSELYKIDENTTNVTILHLSKQ